MNESIVDYALKLCIEKSLQAFFVGLYISDNKPERPEFIHLTRIYNERHSA